MMTSCWSMEDQSNSSNNSFVLAQEPSFIYQTQEEHAPPTQKNIPPQPSKYQQYNPMFSLLTWVWFLPLLFLPKENKKIVFNNYHGRPAITSPTTKNLVCKILSNDHDSLQELPKRYICLICGKRFVRPGSLTTHTYSHTGEVILSYFFFMCYVSLIYHFRNHFNAQ